MKLTRCEQRNYGTHAPKIVCHSNLARSWKELGLGPHDGDLVSVRSQPADAHPGVSAWVKEKVNLSRPEPSTPQIPKSATAAVFASRAGLSVKRRKHEARQVD